MNISVDGLVKRFDSIKANRANWESLWQECADYCLPQKAIITTSRTPGTKLKTDLYDSTAVQAAQIFAAGLHSYLTNPSARWFSLKMRNKALNENSEVKGWLKECENEIFDCLNMSNFNQVIHEDYFDFGVFGLSALYEEEDSEDIVSFSARPPSEIYILVNKTGRIDTVYRYFTYTARQAYQTWGENAGQKVLDAMTSQKVEEPIGFLHIVLPREDRNVRKRDAMNMPFGSIYIEPTTKKILGEGGYEEFPFFIGRCYKVSDSEYAYSPAALALADIKMVNVMSKDIIEAAEKTLHPPVILPHDGYLLPFKTSPKAINYKLSTSPDDKVETLQINREINLSLEMENQRRTIIQRAFFVDLFLMLASLPERDRTATEIAERVNERMLILGPMLGRLMHEKLDPIITRTFNILLRNFQLPSPPELLRGQPYRIEYISPLAKAQKASETRSYTDLVGIVQAMATTNMAVMDNIDMDKVVKRLADVSNVSEILRSDEEVATIREQRMQLETMREVADRAPAVTESLKTLTDIQNPQGKEAIKRG